MTEKAIEELNKLERPSDNPTEAANDLNYLGLASAHTYLLKKKKEVETDEYEIVRDAAQRSKEVTEKMNVNRYLNTLEG